MFILPEGYTMIDMLAREMKERKMSSQSSSRLSAKNTCKYIKAEEKAAATSHFWVKLLYHEILQFSHKILYGL